jgi:peroxiredoxin
MPGIQKLYDTFKDNDKVAFFLVSDEQPSKIKAFIDKKGYDFPVYTSLEQAPKAFYSNSIPTTYVLSKSAVIKIKEVGALNWGGEKSRKIIEDLIAEEL